MAKRTTRVKSSGNQGTKAAKGKKDRALSAARTERKSARNRISRSISSPPHKPDTLRPKPGEFIVRCYRQGLGDCFLLAFGAEPKPRYVLIDCGVHMRQENGSDRMAEVLQNIVESTDKHIDVVVATHEHADHLSGFVQKGSPFVDGSIEVERFWAAWTESPDDQQAERLRRQRGAARSAIRKAIERLSRRSSREAFLAERLDSLLDFETLVGETGVSAGSRGKKNGKASSNEAALEWLRRKADKVKYCEPGEVLRLDKIDRLRVYVLGPPRAEEMLARDLPTGGAQRDGFNEVYLAGAADLLGLRLALDAKGSRPPNQSRIPEHTRYPFDRSQRRVFRESGRGQTTMLRWERKRNVPQDTVAFIETYFADDPWRQISGDWLGVADELALNLNSDTNNTSLVLAFEWGRPGDGQVFLFAADAQVGNWLSWRDRPYRAGRIVLTAEDLLRRTVFYKVGHHGSHNATMKRDTRTKTSEYPLGIPYGLELMSPSLLAYIPVDRDAAARKMPIPWHMPHPPMYQALLQKTAGRVLRSDGLELESGTEGKPLCPPPGGDLAAVPGLPGMRWREATIQFSSEPIRPLYYDLVFRQG